MDSPTSTPSLPELEDQLDCPPLGVGVVAIGRNEGRRLARCLDSIAAGTPAVYVDSGSTDGSRELARERGVEVLELDLARPFTAARARNAGFARLLEIAPQTEIVQFVDGDCELLSDWVERGLAIFSQAPEVAVVCGRRRERARGASVYNTLCDLEWDTPLGEARACGGDALMRVVAFRAAGGFDASLIAGEEPELCFRMRQRGLRVLRIDADMTLHDAALSRFSQWWSRSVRAGHAAAEGMARHRRAGERRSRKRVLGALSWAILLPLAFALTTCILVLRNAWLPALLAAGLLPLVYSLQIVRIARGRERRGDTPRDALLYGLFCMIGKFSELCGMARFWLNRARGRTSALIEYKGAEE